PGKTPFSVGGLFATGNGHQFWVQLGAGLTIIAFDAFGTFVILKAISLVVPLALSKEVLEVGDGAIHGEEIWVPQPHHAPPPLSAPPGRPLPEGVMATTLQS